MGAERSTGRYIAVEGPIGVGKTALARRLAEAFGSELLPEREEANPFLRKFYEDPERYALETQLSFTLDRYRQQQDLARRGVGPGGVVADYLFAKDGIFAGVTLADDELGLYRQIFQLLDAQMLRPDLVVFLEARTDVLVRRIRKRHRDFERGITPEYLGRLTDAFRSFFYQYTDTPLLVINCSEIDFVEHSGDLADLIREVRSMKQGVRHYIPLGSN
jgi:deoxyadenosine/deoxycytidine kinase